MEKPNDRKSLGMFVASMLIFGTVGVLRRYIPLPSALLACTRGILGGLFLMAFVRLRKKAAGAKLPPGVMPRLVITVPSRTARSAVTTAPVSLSSMPG